MKLLLGAFLSLFSLAGAEGQEPIRFARTPDISPDGKIDRLQLPRRHLDRRGHRRRRPAGHHARGPRHQPGLQPRRPIASPSAPTATAATTCSSSPSTAASRARLTFDSATDLVTGWTPDGKTSCSLRRAAPAFPPVSELYTRPGRGRPRAAASRRRGQATASSPRRATRSPTSAGPGTWYRKGYRGSSNDDIWICNADGTEQPPADHLQRPGRLADVVGRRPDRSTTSASTLGSRPTSSARTSRRGQGRHSREAGHQSHRTTASAGPASARNGEWIVYECGADLWVVATKRRAAAQGRHRGQRRRQDQHRAGRHVHRRAPPSTPCRRTSSTSPSSSTARSSCMPIAGRQGRRG